MIVNPTIRDSSDRWDNECEDEILWWPRVVWLDPGKVSGLAVVWFDPRALLVEGKPTPRCVLAWWETYVSGPENVQVDRVLEIADSLRGDGPGLVLGCESFVMRQFNQSDDFLAPVRIRSKLEYAVPKWEEGRKVAIQSPSDALTSITDHRLKTWNMYTPGPDHIRDATRHCLLWVRKMRQQDRGLRWLRAWHGWEKGWVE